MYKIERREKDISVWDHGQSSQLFHKNKVKLLKPGAGIEPADRYGDRKSRRPGLVKPAKQTTSFTSTIDGDAFVYCEQISWSKAESQQIAVRWLLY